MQRILIISLMGILTLGLISKAQGIINNDNVVIITGDTPEQTAKGTKSWGGSTEIKRTFDEFWNDTYLMWESAYTKGCFPDNKAGASTDHIFVLYADGGDYIQINDRYKPSYVDPSIYSITDYSAYYNDVENIFDWLANGHGLPHEIFPMTEDDMLFCYTFDHGGYSGGHSCLCLMGEDVIWDYDFASRVDLISCWRRVFWMQQCFSGGFIDDLSSNKTVITTACRYNERAYPADDVSRSGSPLPENETYDEVLYHHGEFNFHIMNSARGKAIWGTSYDDPPIVDANEDEHIGISMHEAWVYLEAHHSYSGGSIPQHDAIQDTANTTYLIFARLTPPGAPTGLTYMLRANGVILVHLNWDGNIEADLSGYKVYRNGNYLATVRESDYITDAPPPRKRYTFYVTAFDAYGKESGPSNSVTVYGPRPDLVIAESNFDTSTGYNNGKRIVVDGNGRIHICWCSLDSVYYSYTDDRENFVTEAIGLGQFGTIDLYEGKPIISWIDADVEESAIYLSRLTDEGWEKPVLLRSEELEKISGTSMNIVSNIAFFAWAEKEKGVGAPWGVYTGTLDLTGSSLETTLIEQFTSETDVFSPSITEDVTEISLIYDRNGEILYRGYDSSSWSEAQVLSTPKVFASHPSILSYGDRTSATWQEEVWPGIYNIYYTSKLLDGEWETPVRISTSRNSTFPVISGPVVAWAEKISDSIYTVYAQIPYEFGYSVHSYILSGTSEGSNAYPSIAVTQSSEGTELHAVWTQKITEPTLKRRPKYTRVYIDKVATFSTNTGQSEPSVYLVQREGNMNYGYWAHQSVDYHSSELKYRFTNLSPEKEYTLGITFYYKNEDSALPYWVQQPIVDGILLGKVRIESGTPVTFEKCIKKKLYQDGVLDISIRKLVGNYAVCAAIYLYEFDTDATGRGGPMSASTYRFSSNAYHLFQNYPNPYSSSTTIQYQFPKETKVSLKVYNQAGQLVRTLVNETKKAGAYTVRWDGKDRHEIDLPNGVYFYRLEAGDFTSTKKVILIR